MKYTFHKNKKKEIGLGNEWRQKHQFSRLNKFKSPENLIQSRILIESLLPPRCMCVYERLYLQMLYKQRTSLLKRLFTFQCSNERISFELMKQTEIPMKNHSIPGIPASTRLNLVYVIILWCLFGFFWWWFSFLYWFGFGDYCALSLQLWTEVFMSCVRLFIFSLLIQYRLS